MDIIRDWLMHRITVTMELKSYTHPGDGGWHLDLEVTSPGGTLDSLDAFKVWLAKSLLMDAERISFGKSSLQ